MIDPDTALYCLEVGQSSATVIIEPYPGYARDSQATVVDVGESGTQLGRWLQAVGVKRINAIVITHNDSDHIGSLVQLVQVYKTKIDKLFFLVDRTSPPKVLFPIEQWVNDQWINQVRILDCPLSRGASVGGLVLGPPDVTTFRLYCAYPPTVWTYASFGWLSWAWTFFSRGKNALSAVLRLTPSDATMPTHALIGGDLDYRGWEYLASERRDLRCDVFLVPHHGGPQRKSPSFGPSHLAVQTSPTFGLISAGTGNTYKLPHEDLIKELRAKGATVLCTQITQQCLKASVTPASFVGGAVLPRLPNAPCLSGPGVACAGTIIVTFPAAGPSVERLSHHQSAIDALLPSGHSPSCRR